MTENASGPVLEVYFVNAMRRVECLNCAKVKEPILNGFRAGGGISSVVVEGFDSKAKLAMRKAYGFRTYEAIQLALYHPLGALPTPKMTHEFS